MHLTWEEFFEIFAHCEGDVIRMFVAHWCGMRIQSAGNRWERLGQCNAQLIVLLSGWWQAEKMSGFLKLRVDNGNDGQVEKWRSPETNSEMLARPLLFDLDITENTFLRSEKQKGMPFWEVWLVLSSVGCPSWKRRALFTSLLRVLPASSSDGTSVDKVVCAHARAWMHLCVWACVPAGRWVAWASKWQKGMSALNNKSFLAEK